FVCWGVGGVRRRGKMLAAKTKVNPRKLTPWRRPSRNPGMPSDDNKRIHIFDTTLRDGAQTQGVDFGVGDKLAIAEALDRLGVDYIEGGWPGANPTDDAFFTQPPALKNAKLVAFGMTRRPRRTAATAPRPPS